MLGVFLRVLIVLSSNIPDSRILSCVFRNDPNLDFAFSKLFTGTMANIFKYLDLGYMTRVYFLQNDFS
jgi:hypothetical protein